MRPIAVMLLWVAETLVNVKAARTPVASAWCAVRRGCKPGSNDGPTITAEEKRATRPAKLRSGPNQPITVLSAFTTRSCQRSANDGYRLHAVDEEFAVC